MAAFAALIFPDKLERCVSQERAEAVVVRGVDFSETSRIVTFISAERGRFACMAKGVRRGKSAMGAALDTLNRVEVVYYWKDSRSVQQLGEAAILDRFGGIKGDLAKSAYAALIAEIALHTARENEPSGEVYGCFTRGLSSLEHWRGDVQAHACWQMVQLLTVAGFAPALEFCAGCGGPIGGSIGFSYEGGVTCSQCRSDRRLSPEDYARLGALVQSEACPEMTGADAVYRLLRQYAMRQLETDLKSARVVEEMLGI